jgi:hypothetical protein
MKKEKNLFGFYLGMPAAAVRVYLFFILLSTIICRFGECQPPKTARIARLTVCYGQVLFHLMCFN